nr:unnamed protein product [Digitaria exilis]
MYQVLIHLRRVEDFEPRTPPAGSGINGGDAGDVVDSDRLSRVWTFTCIPGVVDGQPAPNHGDASSTGQWRQGSTTSAPTLLPMTFRDPGAARAAKSSDIAVEDVPAPESGERGATRCGSAPPVRSLSAAGPTFDTPTSIMASPTDGQTAPAAPCSDPSATGMGAVRRDAVGGAVPEWAPLELQCKRHAPTTSVQEDPMRVEAGSERACCWDGSAPVPVGSPGAGTPRRTPAVIGPPATAPLRPAAATTSHVPLRTYRRRPRHDGTTTPAARTPPVTPARLDFDTGAPAATEDLQPPEGTWSHITPRRQSSPRPTPAAQKMAKNARSVAPAHDTTPPPNLNSNSPTAANTPATAAAMAATTAFLAGITLATRSPLIRSIPGDARVAFTVPDNAVSMPRRSSRLPSQPLNVSVRPSKKGEILAMKRFGLLPEGVNSGAAIDKAGEKLDNFFDDIIDVKNLPALRDLFPAARGLSNDEMVAAARQAGVAKLLHLFSSRNRLRLCQNPRSKDDLPRELETSQAKLTEVQGLQSDILDVAKSKSSQLTLHTGADIAPVTISSNQEALHDQAADDYIPLPQEEDSLEGVDDLFGLLKDDSHSSESEGSSDSEGHTTFHQVCVRKEKEDGCYPPILNSKLRSDSEGRTSVFSRIFTVRMFWEQEGRRGKQQHFHQEYAGDTALVPKRTKTLDMAISDENFKERSIVLSSKDEHTQLATPDLETKVLLQDEQQQKISKVVFPKSDAECGNKGTSFDQEDDETMYLVTDSKVLSEGCVSKSGLSVDRTSGHLVADLLGMNSESRTSFINDSSSGSAEGFSASALNSENVEHNVNRSEAYAEPPILQHDPGEATEKL